MAKKEGETAFVKGIYCNREYSWLQFNRRVLDQACDLTNPLLERCKFLAIFCSNLDEFFMVRVGSLLNESKLDPVARENKTELTAQEQVEGILAETKKLYQECSVAFSRLKAELAKNGMRILRPSELTVRQRTRCEAHFFEAVLPLLSPMVLDSKHPMIRFENTHLYMMFELEREGRDMFGVMAIPPAAERLYRIEGGKKINLIAVEDLVSEFGYHAFPGYTVKGKALIRVTRNADFDTNVDDADLEHDFDFSKYMKRKVELRSTLDAVRVETDKNSDTIRAFVRKSWPSSNIRLSGGASPPTCFRPSSSSNGCEKGTCFSRTPSIRWSRLSDCSTSARTTPASRRSRLPFIGSTIIRGS